MEAGKKFVAETESWNLEKEVMDQCCQICSNFDILGNFNNGALEISNISWFKDFWIFELIKVA